MLTRSLRTCAGLLAALSVAHCGTGPAPTNPDGSVPVDANPADCDPLAGATPDPARGVVIAGDLAFGETMVELSDARGFVGYRFTAAANQPIRITLASQMDAYLLVYGPMAAAGGAWGQPIARDDNTEGGTNARVSLTAMTAGTYLVVATTRTNAAACRPADRGAATLTLENMWLRAPELGAGDRSATSVTLTPVMTASMNRPSAMAFNPNAPDELWITNRGNDSFTIVNTADLTQPVAVFRDPSAHFLNKPTSLSFSDNETLGTCQESANDYNGTMRPNNFMGPVVHPAQRSRIAQRRVDGAHLDMLHHSPMCMGIVSTGGTEFWVFNGTAGSIDRYDFHEFHAPGTDDHSDGLTWRYADGELLRVPNVPSHMAFDRETRTIYISDTGHGRVVALDASQPPPADAPQIATPINETPLYAAEGTSVRDVVPAASGMVTRPSGLVLHHGMIFVADNANGRITAFTLDGQMRNYLDTGLQAGALTGLAMGPDGKLYFLDSMSNSVMRIDP